MPDPFAPIRNVMSFQAQIEGWKQEDYIRRMKKEKRRTLTNTYAEAMRKGTTLKRILSAGDVPGAMPLEPGNPQIEERIERDLVRWEASFRRGKEAATGPLVVSTKATGVGLGKERELSTEERRSLKAQGLDVSYDITKGEVPALIKALATEKKATIKLTEQATKRQWEEYKLEKTDELSTKRLFISNALSQQSANIKWQRGEDKRALDNQFQVMKMEKAQLDLMELRKPVQERADNMYKLMMKQVDLNADVQMEQLRQQGRETLVGIRAEEQRITKMTAPPKEDSITRFNRALPQMQTVGDILRYYVGEKYKTEDAWSATRLAAESLGIKTDINFDADAGDKMEFYRTPLPVPQALNARTTSFGAYSSYDEVIQKLQEWGLDPQTDPEAADILQQAQQYFQYTGGATGSF